MDDLIIGQWNIRGIRNANRCKIVRNWVSSLRYPINAFCLQELKTNVDTATFQLNSVFACGHISLDVSPTGRVRTTVILLNSQPILAEGNKGDGGFSWVKTTLSRGEAYIGLVYGSYRRNKRVELWKWMEKHLEQGN